MKLIQKQGELVNKEKVIKKVLEFGQNTALHIQLESGQAIPC
ncbi:hypothetical protein [Bacillus sp. FJAT-49736]|nr:hypothetical protein [Bacillus sp. FJAT-49736]